MDIFEELKLVDARIRYLNKEIRHIESRLNISGPCLGEIKTKNKKSHLEEKVVALVDYKSELENQLVKEVNLRQKLWMIVSVLPKQQMIDIANYMILEHMTAQNVAEILSYSTKTVRRLVQKTKDIISSEYNNPDFMRLVDLAIKEDKSLSDVLIDFDYVVEEKVCDK